MIGKKESEENKSLLGRASMSGICESENNGSANAGSDISVKLSPHSQGIPSLPELRTIPIRSERINKPVDRLKF